MTHRKTHCLRGHPLIPENIYYRTRRVARKDGTISMQIDHDCKECIRIRTRKKHLQDRKGIITELPPGEVERGDTCPHGHVMTPDNTYVSSFVYTDRKGVEKQREQRKCKTCKAEYRKRWAEQGRKGLVKMCINGHVLTNQNTAVELAGTVLVAGVRKPKITRRCLTCRKKGYWARERAKRVSNKLTERGQYAS